MSEKFNLKWNDFGSNASRSFGLFRNESYLHDVTLVSEDFKQIPAHKLVLSACSEFFKNILQQTKQSQPLVCLDGINSVDLQNVLDYVYEGEVRIYQENLDRFLDVAQKLKLDGLLGNNENHESEDIKEDETFSKPSSETEETPQEEPKTKMRNLSNPKPRKSLHQIPAALFNGTVALNDTFNLEEHKQKLKEQIITNDDRSVSCKICGKTSAPNQRDIGKARSNMRNHVEIHFEGISYPCPSCDKTFRSARRLHTHCKSH